MARSHSFEAGSGLIGLKWVKFTSSYKNLSAPVDMPVSPILIICYHSVPSLMLTLPAWREVKNNTCSRQKTCCCTEKYFRFRLKLRVSQGQSGFLEAEGRCSPMATYTKTNKKKGGRGDFCKDFTIFSFSCTNDTHWRKSEGQEEILSGRFMTTR